MNKEQFDIMKNRKGFIAALDQSGGSTPKALALYGISEDSYNGEEEMFTLVHEMRSRIITFAGFQFGPHIGGHPVRTNDGPQSRRPLYGRLSVGEKGVVPLLKVDKGLDTEADGVQLMKPNPDLDALLARANERHIFGTKMRSVIKSANREGIKKVVAQQFEVGKQIIAAGLILIIEPEVDIHSTDKAESEAILKEELLLALDALSPDQFVMLKLSIPSVDDFYKELIAHPQVVRVVALSGGYSREEANEKLTPQSRIDCELLAGVIRRPVC